jgi:hypothetical protein
MATMVWVDNLCFICHRIEDLRNQIAIATREERALKLSAETSSTAQNELDQRNAAETLSRLREQCSWMMDAKYEGQI